jgi:hypothetical protein
MICLLCLFTGMAMAGAKCRTANGRIIYAEQQCPVGSMVEEYTAEDPPALLWPHGNAPKLSINIRNSDLRTTLHLLGQEMVPGQLFIDNEVSGSIDLREFDIPVDRLFYKVLQMKSLEVMKIRNHYYVYPASMGRSVAASMAALKGL